LNFILFLITSSIEIFLYLSYSFLSLWQGVNNTFLKFEFYTFILFLIILNIIEIFFIFIWLSDKFFTGHWRDDNKQVLKNINVDFKKDKNNLTHCFGTILVYYIPPYSIPMSNIPFRL